MRRDRMERGPAPRVRDGVQPQTSGVDDRTERNRQTMRGTLARLAERLEPDLCHGRAPWRRRLRQTFGSGESACAVDAIGKDRIPGVADAAEVLARSIGGTCGGDHLVPACRDDGTRLVVRVGRRSGRSLRRSGPCARSGGVHWREASRRIPFVCALPGGFSCASRTLGVCSTGTGKVQRSARPAVDSRPSELVAQSASRIFTRATSRAARSRSSRWATRWRSIPSMCSATARCRTACPSGVSTT